MTSSRDASAAYVADPDFTLYVGDALTVLRSLPDGAANCCVTSPPYWGLRDYGAAGQLGLEPTPEAYVAALVAVLAEARRVLRSDGTLWLNLGDSYSHGGNGSRDPEKWPKQSRNDHRIEHRNTAGGKPKDLCGIPWRVALALREDGWFLRSDIIWHKPNAMPESVTDRPTKAHEYLFLLSREPRYFYDADAIREPYKYDGRKVTHVEGREGSIQHRSGERWPGLKPRRSGNAERKANPAAVLGRGDTSHGVPWEEGDAGRNARTVWEIATQPFPGAHFATFPEELARRCIAAGCPAGGIVLDPFMGSGTVALVARRLGRKSIGIEINPEYAQMAAQRLAPQSLLTETVA